MPQMRFRVRWPDDTVTSCYSPSLVIKDYFEVGQAYALEDFVARSRESLTIASARVKAKYGFSCTAAAEQLQAITDRAAEFAGAAQAQVIIEGFDE